MVSSINNTYKNYNDLYKNYNNTNNNNLNALKALDIATNVAANNIANVQTDNFESSRVVLNSSINGDIQATLSKANAIGPNNYSPGTIGQAENNGKTKTLSDTELEKEFTNMMNFQNSYGANLKAIQNNNDMKGDVINMMA